MAILVVAQSAEINLLALFFYYEFYKILDTSFHTKILQFPLKRISSVNYRLRHARHTCHKAILLSFWCFSERFCPMGLLNVCFNYFNVILIKIVYVLTLFRCFNVSFEIL